MADAPLILAVDDSALQRAQLHDKLAACGYRVLMAENGQEALAQIEAQGNAIDAIVLDREMPVMDGMTLARHLKAQPKFRRLPIVMLTALDKPEQIEQGIAAGVFYYLTKPLEEGIFQAVLAAAIADSRRTRALGHELQRHRASFALLEEARFDIATPQQAEDTASFLANAFPQPDRVINGIAELLLNAVEHGTLQLGYEAKAALLARDVTGAAYRAELAQRSTAAALSHRRASVQFRREAEWLLLTVSDPGPGFDWHSWLRFDPARAAAKNGRGIAQAHLLAFDRLQFNEAGNVVTALVRRTAG